jgi:hypothetical protein
MAIRRYFREGLIWNPVKVKFFDDGTQFIMPDLYPEYTEGSPWVVIFGDDIKDSDLLLYDDIAKLKGNDAGFLRTVDSGKESETVKAPLYFKTSNGMFSGSPYQSNGTVYAPGRVIYERIADYKTYTLTDNSPIQDNKYRKFSNFTTNVFEVKFNWAIESTIPSGSYWYIKYENFSIWFKGMDWTTIC